MKGWVSFGLLLRNAINFYNYKYKIFPYILRIHNNRRFEILDHTSVIIILQIA